MSANKRLILDLCLPVYNEEVILASNVQRVVDFIHKSDLKVDCRIVILVNGSTDRSAQIARALAERWPDLVDFRDYPAGGRGHTLLAYADTSQADWWGYMDIDLAVDLADLPQLLTMVASKAADLVVASRFLSGASCSRSFSRELISSIYNWLARCFLGTSIKDHQCGCKFISRSWWKTIRPRLKDTNWFLDTEMIAWTAKLGGRVLEYPVHWVDNRHLIRSTKVKLGRDIINFITNLFQLRRRLKAEHHN